MDKEAFRTWSHKAADWGVDYRASLRSLPVRSQVAPGETYNAVPESAPESAEPMETIFADFEKIILPGITHWQHPRLFPCQCRTCIHHRRATRHRHGGAMHAMANLAFCH
jgi:aromatic-L-amino-acid/L-tryptophan decarboxylase